MSREGIESFDKIMNCQLLDRYNLTDRKIPAITVKGREIRFNLNAIHLLSDCLYVQILVNRDEKYMIILPCEKNDVSAVDWCKISRKTGKVESKDITSKFLSPKLYALMEWNKESSYKIECFFQDFGEGRTLLFFDLTEYVELGRKELTCNILGLNLARLSADLAPIDGRHIVLFTWKYNHILLITVDEYLNVQAIRQEVNGIKIETNLSSFHRNCRDLSVR